MTTPSRLHIDPTTLLPSVQNFSELSNFLRSAVADEESLQMGDSMGLLASQIEAIVAKLKQGAGRDVVAPLFMDLLTVLREHRQLVIGLSTPWRGLYEYASYLAALNNFRVLIGQWLVERGPPVALADFELMAWRALGEGMLMIDMYEQWRAQEKQDSNPADLDDSRVARAKSWWDKLRG